MGSDGRSVGQARRQTEQAAAAAIRRQATGVDAAPCRRIAGTLRNPRAMWVGRQAAMAGKCDSTPKRASLALSALRSRPSWW